MAESSRRGSTLGGTVKDQSTESYRLLVGDYLLKAGHITRGQLEEGTKWLKANPGQFLSVFLLKKNYIESATVSIVLSRQYNFPMINLPEREIEPELAKILPYEQAKKYLAVPYRRQDNKLYLAMLEPTNGRALEELAALTHHQLMAGVAPFSSLVETFKRVYAIDDHECQSFLNPLDPRDSDEAGPVTVDNLGALISDALDDFSFGDTSEDDGLAGDLYSAENSTIINLANQILVQAIQEGASDVHIEPFERQFYVRYRIDGALYKRTRLPLEIRNALIARLKIMARLDITERRVPQDGRIKLRMSKTREIDFRVSSLPTLFGESVVLRILDKSGLNVDLSKLGLTQRNLDQVRQSVYRPNGLFLVTGPTGSGKTVTLYSCLQLRNTDDVKILTAEDPVEFNFPGVNQVNVVNEVGMTFARALRAFLRQDPDICMIGEIRDLETAEIAVEAAMTGHLVLSTLHTNDAPSTITRLTDMGVPSFNLSASLVLCTAQRLLRRICPNCKQPMGKLSANKLIEAGFHRNEAASIQLYEGRGCPACKGSGYKGRVGIFEIMEMTPFLAEAISSQVPESQLRKIALKEGMATLRQDAVLKATQGLTTLEQVLEKTVLQKESLPHYLLNPDELVFGNDDIIIKEGNADTNFYKLIQGSLAVYKGSAQIAEISQINTFFGEMGALTGGQRTATIKSQGKSIVKVFPGDKLLEVIEGYPDIAKTMLTTLVDRLSSTNTRLSQYIKDKMELERTYITHLTAGAGSIAGGGARPIASAPKRSLPGGSLIYGDQPKDEAVSPGEAPRPIAGSEPALRPIAGSEAPRPIAASGAAPRSVISADSTAAPASSRFSPARETRSPAAVIQAEPQAAPAAAPLRDELSERLAAPYEAADVTRLVSPKSLKAAPAVLDIAALGRAAPRARELKVAPDAL